MLWAIKVNLDAERLKLGYPSDQLNCLAFVSGSQSLFDTVIRHTEKRRGDHPSGQNERTLGNCEQETCLRTDEAIRKTDRNTLQAVTNKRFYPARSRHSDLKCAENSEIGIS